MSVLLSYGAVSRFSFLGGGVTATSDFSFLVSRFSFLVPRFSFLGGGVTGPLLGNHYEFFYAVNMCFKSNMMFIRLCYCS